MKNDSHVPINVAISRQGRASQHEPFLLTRSVCTTSGTVPLTVFRAQKGICHSSCNGTEPNRSAAHSCQRRQQDLALRSLIKRREDQEAQTPASGQSCPPALTPGGCSAEKDDCVQVGL